MPQTQKVKEFFKKYHMFCDDINMNDYTKEFQRQMVAGLKGEKSSLQMLPTFLSVNNPVPFEEPIIVMDAGGTNFRVAVVTFHKDEKPSIEHFEKSHMPGTKGQLSADKFFAQIVDRLLPVAEYSNKVGFCFSFPADIQPNRDGKLVLFTKEVDVKDVVGKLLGENLNKVLRNRGLEEKDFVILNDTVAAMLGGISKVEAGNNSRVLGFIYGTGINTCYAEKTENITKSPAAMEHQGKMIINMESGGFDGFPQGDLDKKFDATTQDPGICIFEKMSSGAYFGGMLNTVLVAAMEDGYLSKEFKENYSYESEVPMWDMNSFVENPRGENPLATFCKDENEAEFLAELISKLVERTARFTAIHFAAIFEQMAVESSPENPIIITAEGTTFEKTKLYRKHLDRYLKEFVEGEMNHYCRYISVEDVTLLGAAVAGLIG